MRILVVDDEACLARAVHRGLKDHDVTVELHSAKAFERVAAAEAAGEPYDLVLCDYSMKPLTGVEVASGLRTGVRPPMLILMTGYDAVSDADRLIVDAVLLKPFNTAQLVETIEGVRAARRRKQTRRMRTLRPTDGLYG